MKASSETVGAEPEVRWLGRLPYAEGLRLQEEVVHALLGGSGPEVLLLLEHDPVFTIGRTQDRSSLGDPANLPAPLVEIGRGGKATWHGPGQVPAERSEGLTGVWVGGRKLASIGVGARQWISMHGFAINIAGALDGFAAITPCGIDGVSMTSLEREGVSGMDVEAAAHHFAPYLLSSLRALRRAGTSG